MKRILLAVILAIVGSVPLFAQNDALQGHCDLGGTKALVSGLGSTNYNEGIVPGCTVSVYLTGTTTLATIYSNSTGTVLANPFTAVQLPSPNAGYWIFWAATGQGYDVKLSGGNGNPSCTTAPNCYTTPLTYTDLKVGGGGGGSGVTSVSCDPAMGNLLGCNVSNPGTTPGFHWTLNNQSGNSIFGNFQGSTGPPFFATYTCTGLLTCAFNTGTNTINFNVPTSTALSITATSPIRVNGGTGPVSSGTANIDCPTCGQASLEMTPVPPISGQYVIIHPTGNTGFASGYCSNPFLGGGNTSVILQMTAETSTFPPSDCHITWTYTGALAAQAPWVVPGNITAVYAFAFSSLTNDNVGFVLNEGSVNLLPFGVGSRGNWPTQQTTALTGLNGSTLEGSTGFAQISRSGTSTPAPSILTVTNIGYIVYYTGTAPPADNAINILPPLMYSPDYNNHETLWLDPTFPTRVVPVEASALASLFPPGPNVGNIFAVKQALNSTDCSVGGGTSINLCVSDGTSYSIFSGGGGGGAVSSVSNSDGTVTISPTTGAVVASLNLAHANTWTAKQSQPAPLLTDVLGSLECLQANSSGQMSGTGAPCGAGTISNQANGVIPLATGATALGAQSHLDENTSGQDTFSQKVVVSCLGCPSQVTLTYNSGHAPTVGGATDAVYAVDASGNAEISEAGGAFARICDATNGVCSGGTPFISSLTTTGTSGPATVVSGVLNVPQYSGGGGSGQPAWTSTTISPTTTTLAFPLGYYHFQVPASLVKCASLTCDVQIGTVPQGFVLHTLTVVETTPFAGPSGLTAGTMSFGQGVSAPSGFMSPRAIFQSANTTNQEGGAISMSFTTAATSFTVEFINTSVSSPINFGNGTTSSLTAGLLDVYVTYSVQQ